MANDGPLDLDDARRRRDDAGALEDAAADGAQSLEELEAKGMRAEDDGQFSLNAGERATRGTLIPRNTPIEHAIVFGTRRVEGRELGLVRFGESVLYLSRGLAGPTRDVPRYDGDENVKSVTTEQAITPKRVVNADSDEAMEMLAGILEKRGYRLVRDAA